MKDLTKTGTMEVLDVNGITVEAGRQHTWSFQADLTTVVSYSNNKVDFIAPETGALFGSGDLLYKYIRFSAATGTIVSYCLKGV